jgi:hypothetical protein
MFIARVCDEGKTLKQKIERGPLKIEDGPGITIQVSEGLKKAHAKRVIIFLGC